HEPRTPITAVYQSANRCLAASASVGAALGCGHAASPRGPRMASMPDPLLLSARAAAQEIAAGRLTAEALVTACLDRIGAREPVVGAWDYLDRDAALAAARRCDGSPPSGPLHGI